VKAWHDGFERALTDEAPRRHGGGLWVRVA
jgi:hypothetical protein